MTARFLVLAWHSINVTGNDYANNDLVAFGRDLEGLDRNGWTILPLGDALAGLDSGDLPARTAVLTLDDGSIMDWHPFDHPTAGPQQSAYQRLSAFATARREGSRHRLHASVFVQASPDARAELDRTDYFSLGVWGDDWWAAANASGLMTVENHSWDHNHPSLARTAGDPDRPRNFLSIDDEASCRAEIEQASDCIERIAGRRPRYFAYPWGQASDYLRGEFLPRYGESIGLEAALGCDPGAVTRGSDRWYLPRYVCGRDWSSPEGFEAVLRDAAAGS
ncbi:polysaccharide deacetylase family protein [Halomonas denitrificans]|nr:polysaccharide deacetylase family protein [Halomonas denitrificans]